MPGAPRGSEILVLRMAMIRREDEVSGTISSLPTVLYAEWFALHRFLYSTCATVHPPYACSCRYGGQFSAVLKPACLCREAGLGALSPAIALHQRIYKTTCRRTTSVYDVQ